MEEIINKLKDSDLKLLERLLGIPYDRMYKWIKGKSKPKTEDFNTLKSYFEHGIISISPEKNQFNPRIEALPIHLAADPNDYDNDGTRFEELGDGTFRMRIPVVPHKAFAGYLRGFKDPEYYEDLEYVSIEVFKQHRAHYLAFEVKGDSMTTLEPELFRKSIFDGVKVVGRELARHQWAYKLHTHNYDNWVIVHKTEGILIKQITNHDVENGIITIHSLNPDKTLYPDEDLKLDDIEQIFNVVKKIDDL
jgi:phage repressor protein C with HTH and peptisase S24 domain